MSDRWSKCMSGPISTAATTQVGFVGSAAAGRIHVYDWLFGHVGAADDTVIHNYIARYTAIPTAAASGGEPIALDMAAASHGTTSMYASTTGTVANCLIAVPTNQRASHRWVAAPDGELVIPSTTLNGIVYYAVGTITTNMLTTFHWVS